VQVSASLWARGIGRRLREVAACWGEYIALQAHWDVSCPLFRRLRMHHSVEALRILHRVEQVWWLSHRVTDGLSLDGWGLSLDDRVLPGPLA